MRAGGWLGVPERRSASDAGAFSQRVGGSAMIAGDARKPVGQGVRGAKRRHRFVNGVPNFFAQLNTFDILREIVQPREQTERIPKRRPCRLSDAGGDSHPRLLTELDHDPVFGRLDAHGEGGLPAGHRSHAGGDLHRHFVFLPDRLRAQIAAIKFRRQRAGDIVWRDAAVKDSSVHEFDYNPLHHQRRLRVVALYISMKLYAVRQFWFKFFASLLAALSVGTIMLTPARQAEAFQGDAPTPTGIVITVTYTDPMNVRAGPGTFYDVIGQLFPGDVRSVLGISPGREWIQISFDGGIGWVYASYVSISGGEPQIVEPPPTPTPLTTATIDPTLAAAFNRQPTETRMPTFTPPPPLTVPAFASDPAPQARGVPFGYFIVILGALGAIGLGFSLLARK